LVNPTMDGMNLVAKEALFLGESAPLLLSVNAGAYEELAGHVTPVEPFDVEYTALTMLDAMGRGVSPEQAAGRDLLRGQDAASCLARLTESGATRGKPCAPRPRPRRSGTCAATPPTRRPTPPRDGTWASACPASRCGPTTRSPSTAYGSRRRTGACPTC